MKQTYFLTLLMMDVLALSLTENITPTDNYKVIMANASSFNVSETITIKAVETNATWIPYFTMTASFTQNIDEKLAVAQNYYLNHNNLIDMEGAKYGTTQFINILKDNANQTDLYIIIYNLNPFFRSQPFEISIEVENGQQCRGCLNGNSNGCKCAGNCNDGYFGSHCNRQYERFKDRWEIDLKIPKNSIKHYIVDDMKYLNLLTQLLNGSVEMYHSIHHDGISFPGYLNVSIDKGQKGFYRFDSQHKYYTIHERQIDQIYLTFTTYNQEATLSLRIYQTPLSVVAIVFICIGGVVGLIILVCIIANVIAYCMESQSYQHHQVSQGELMPAVNLQNVYDIKRTIGNKKIQQVYDYYQKQQRLDWSCPICMTPIHNHDQVKVGYCGHIYHPHCIDQWLGRSQICPFCRHGHSYNEMMQSRQIVYSQYPQATQSNEHLVAAILKMNDR